MKNKINYITYYPTIFIKDTFGINYNTILVLQYGHLLL